MIRQVYVFSCDLCDNDIIASESYREVVMESTEFYKNRQRRFTYDDSYDTISVCKGCIPKAEKQGWKKS